MKVSATDPRSIRTCDLMRNALMKLAAEKNFTSLTIGEVTNLAGLNRTTFYLHYAGLHELLEDCARTLFSQMRAEIYANELSDFRQDTATLVPFVKSVFQHLEQHEAFYRTMLGKQGDSQFRALFQKMLSELIFEPIVNQNPSGDFSPKVEMTLRFFSAGFTEIAAWWLEKGKPISVEQASQQVVRDILPDYLRLMEK